MPDTVRPSRILIVCAEDPGDAGQVPDVLAAAGCSCDIVCRKARSSTVMFDPARHRGLVIMGDGKARASARRYDREREWARTAIERGLPVLGVCHGAQLLAHLHGGRLSASSESGNIDEGLGELSLTDAGRQDSVLQNAAMGAGVYQYHCEVFTVPSVAVNLAESGNRERPHSDAFRIGANVYGLHFHPELTVPTLVDWLKLPRANEAVERAAVTGRSVLAAWVRLALT